MNLVLFTPEELAAPLPRSDPRAEHVLTVLRRAVGDTFDAGVIDGPRGKATVTALTAAALTLAFTPTHEPAPLPPLTLLIGLPRPQTARDILRDATTLGVGTLHFIATERADANYATATLWSSGEWRRHVLAGAAQAFDTRLPAVTWTHSLASVLAVASLNGHRTTALDEADATRPKPRDPASPVLPAAAPRLALDNYEAVAPLAAALATHPPGTPLVLALGPERGWGPADRTALRAAGFTLVHLGPRVLRLETAVTATLSLAHARSL